MNIFEITKSSSAKTEFSVFSVFFFVSFRFFQYRRRCRFFKISRYRFRFSVTDSALVVIRLKVPIEMHYTVIPMGTSKVNSSRDLFPDVEWVKFYVGFQTSTHKQRSSTVPTISSAFRFSIWRQSDKPSSINRNTNASVSAQKQLGECMVDI